MRPPLEVWGILNVTPDSFSDGGRFLLRDAAVAHARALIAEGASVIDVGGASSRPPGTTYGAGASPVSIEEEIARVEGVIADLASKGRAHEGCRVSIDTTRGSVAERALRVGASIVNDVSMGADPELLEAAARHGATLVLMHTRLDGRIDERTTDYGGDVVAGVRDELARAVERAVQAGVKDVWVDPGIGFAKTARQSATLLARLGELSSLPILVGASRKSFIASLAPERDGSAPPPSARLPGSLLAVAAAVRGGARAVRVHDVAPSRQAILFEAALLEAGLFEAGLPEASLLEAGKANAKEPRHG